MHRRRDEGEPLDVERALAGVRRRVAKREGEWFVQTMSQASAVKAYTCPACGGAIAPGTAHLVVWRADSILGDDDALAARRHWHRRCFEATP